MPRQFTDRCNLLRDGIQKSRCQLRNGAELVTTEWIAQSPHTPEDFFTIPTHFLHAYKTMFFQL
uniref:Uncharacterized protein n=1 Tax=Anguilla anguilla TaxID=7936 RepID=A0A0E9WSN2_ANGAN